jgi:hypothetical protein
MPSTLSDCLWGALIRFTPLSRAFVPGQNLDSACPGEAVGRIGTAPMEVASEVERRALEA